MRVSQSSETDHKKIQEQGAFSRKTVEQMCVVTSMHESA